MSYEAREQPRRNVHVSMRRRKTEVGKTLRLLDYVHKTLIFKRKEKMMEDKGIQGFLFSWYELISINLPFLFVAIYDVLTWPLRLIWNTVIPDYLLF